MAKVNKAYPTLLGGVSQQAPELRRPGQHWSQTNMVSDPVVGLTRRPGSLYVGEETPTAIDTDDAANYRAIDFRVAGKEYALFVPFAPRTNVLVAQNAYCLNKTDNAIVPVDIAGDATVQALLNGGLSAAVPVGRFVLMAGADLPVTYTTSEDWASAENQSRFVAWVRQGGYSKRYRIALIRGNQKFWVEYTTLSASYPDPLDTSDIVTDDPDYIKKVNDRTNQYNANVTAWIGRALEDALPTNVAEKLAYELEISGFLSPSATVEVNGSTICITDDTIEEIEVDDGADNSSIRGIGNTVGAPELLSTIHYPGKIVQIRPNSSTEGNVFYLKARAKDQSTGSFTAVTWEECPGVLYTPTSALAFATVEGGTCYIAPGPDQIEALSGAAFGSYVPSECGDADSSPVPAFLDNGIDCLGLFQDRLIIGSGPTFFASRPGDYLNWFRASVLSVQANDPVSFVAIGGEDDTLRNTVIYDRNLVLFGDKQQYLIDGRKALEPRTASATIMASYPNAAEMRPMVVGNYLFYGKTSDNIATLHQLKPGAIAESPESSELSQVLEDYLPGRPWELKAGTSPNNVYLRTTDGNDSVFVYSYLDDQSGNRLFEAWNKWQFASVLGNVAGISLYDGFLYVGFFRDTEFVVDRVPLNNKTDRPYLDSQLVYVGPSRGASYVRADGREGGYAGGATGVYEGVEIEGEVGLTSPFIRDREDNALLEGRLTVSAVKVNLKDSGGIGFDVTEAGGTCWGLELHGVDSAEVAEDLNAVRIGPACAEAEPLGLNLGSSDMVQLNITNYADMVQWRQDYSAGFTTVNGGSSYYPEGGVQFDGDYIFTTDGTPDYTARVTGPATFKVKLTGQRLYGGLLMLEDNGKNVQYTGADGVDGAVLVDLFGTPTWVYNEYSYGTQLFDGELEGMSYPFTPGAKTREGVLVQFIFVNGTMIPWVVGYAQQFDETGNDYEVIPGYPALIQQYVGSAITLPASAYTQGVDEFMDPVPALDEYRVEFYYTPDTRSLEVWALDTEGARVERIWPELGSGGDVVGVQQVLDNYSYGAPTAGYIRTRGFFSGGDNVSGFSVYATGSTSDCPATVEGPTDRVTGDCTGTPIVNGIISLSDIHPAGETEYTDTGPYQTASVTIPIGRETRDYRLTLRPYKWAPLTIANVEWVGQYFNNTRRI